MLITCRIMLIKERNYTVYLSIDYSCFKKGCRKSVQVSTTTSNANFGSFQVLDLAGFLGNLRT